MVRPACWYHAVTMGTCPEPQKKQAKTGNCGRAWGGQPNAVSKPALTRKKSAERSCNFIGRLLPSSKLQPVKALRRKSTPNWRRPVIRHGRPTKYGWIVSHPAKFFMGKGTDIGAFSYIQAQEGVEIGQNAQVGSHCSVYSVSTIDNKRGKVVIGRNARIGSHSVIMPGVTIGPNTVVGAMSFVNRDLPANVVAYGCPVRIVKKLKKV